MTFTNKDRAARIGKLLSRFNKHDLPHSCLIDILADARHWCDRHGKDFGKLDREAYNHYVTEIVAEQEGCHDHDN